MDRSFCDVVKGRKSAPRAASGTRADASSKLPESRLAGRESGGVTSNAGSPSQVPPSRSSGTVKVGKALSGDKVGKLKVNPVTVPVTSGPAREGEVGWQVAMGKKKRRAEKASANSRPAQRRAGKASADSRPARSLPVFPEGGVSTGGAARRAPAGPRQTAPSAGGVLSKGSSGNSSSSMGRNVRSGKASSRPGGMFSGVGNPSTTAPRGRQGTLELARVSDVRGKASLGHVSPLTLIQAEHDKHKASVSGFPAPPPRGRRVVRKKTDVGTAAETLRGPSQTNDNAQKSRAELKDAARCQQRTRAVDVPSGKEATKSKRFRVDADDLPSGKEARKETKATMKVLSKTKAAGVSSSKTPLRVSGAERTAKPKTDSTLASGNVGQALARPRAGVVGGTETGQARIDGKRKESGAVSLGVDNVKAGNTKLRQKKGECRQGSRSTEGHSTGQAEKGAKVANRADASVKRWGELVTVAKRAVAANEAIESLQRKEKVRVRARAEIAAQETSDTKAKARTQTKTGNVGTGTRVKATEAETSRKHGETTRKVRIAKRPKGNGSIACPVDAHVIVYADAPVPEGDRSRLGPCSPEAPPPSGRSLGGAGDRKVPPPQEPVDRDARMGGATDRVAAAHAQDGARSSSTARASLGSAHGPANAYSSAEGGASSSLRGPSLPGCAGAGGGESCSL